jgi:hypothetical protein
MRVPAFMLEYQQPSALLTLLEDAFDPWSDLEWAEHVDAMQAVASHPEGMTLEQIGQHMGITRERVRQIEAGALRKLKNADGFAVLICGDTSLAIPDCERCGQPFVRKTGRDRRCEDCTLLHRRRGHRASAHPTRHAFILEP